MNAIKWKPALYLILVIAAVISTIKWMLGDKEFSIKFVTDCIGTSVTVITLLTGLFCSTFWKFKCFRKWLVLIPNLNGAWQGTIASNWIDPETKQKKEIIPTTLIIKQSLFKTSCLLKTEESTSRSIVANFFIDEDDQICRLIYTYQNDSKSTVRDRSPIHYGTTSLEIVEEHNTIMLHGDYWTSRGTSGMLSFNSKDKEN